MEQFSQFKLQHALAAITTFAVAGAVYPRDPGLGAGLLVATAGVWFGVMVLMLSNAAANGEDFENRSPTNQIAVATGQIVISACGTILIVLWTLVLIGMLLFVTGF